MYPCAWAVQRYADAILHLIDPKGLVSLHNYSSSGAHGRRHSCRCAAMAPALARDCSKAPVQHCALRPTPTAQSVLAWHLPQWAVRVLRFGIGCIAMPSSSRSTGALCSALLCSATAAYPLSPQSAVGGMLRVACCMLRVACCMLRAGCCMLHAACCSNAKDLRLLGRPLERTLLIDNADYALAAQPSNGVRVHRHGPTRTCIV